MHFKTTVWDRDVNLQHFLHVYTMQNSDKFECLLSRIKTDGRTFWWWHVVRKKREKKSIRLKSKRIWWRSQTANVSTAFKSAVFFLQCGYNFNWICQSSVRVAGARVSNHTCNDVQCMCSLTFRCLSHTTSTAINGGK